MNDSDREALATNDQYFMDTYAHVKWHYLLTEQQRRNHTKIKFEKSFWQLAIGISLVTLSALAVSEAKFGLGKETLDVFGLALLPGSFYLWFGSVGMFEPILTTAEIIAINTSEVCQNADGGGI